MFVGGEPVPPMSFMVREYLDYRYIRNYVRTGHRICIFDVKPQFQLSLSEHYQWLDDKLSKLMGLSDDLYLILAPYIAFPKAWWDEHPDELTRYEDGSVLPYPEGVTGHFPDYPLAGRKGTYSFASRSFERDGAAMLRGYVRFLRSRPYADRVIGLFPQAGSTHEWNLYAGPAAHDFSPAMQRAFQAFTRRKYGTVAALRRAWGEGKVDFDSVRVPSADSRKVAHKGSFRDPSIDRRVVDYYECVTNEVFCRMRAFARAVKSASGRRLLVGFYCGTTQDGGPGGHPWVAYHRCRDIDFAASPLAYEQRSPGNHSPLHQVIDSMHLHNKVFFSEDDLRPAWPVKDRRAEQSVRRYGGGFPRAEVLEVFKKEILQNVICGVQGWWYDFHYRWYDRPEYWRLFDRLNRVFALSFRHDRRKDAEIAIVFDEDSHRYFAPDNRVCRNLYHRQMIAEMGRLGASADQIMHDDLGHGDLPDYKLYIFLNCFRLTGRERRAIDRLKGRGRTLLFFYGAGYINDDRRPALSTDHMRALTGISFREVAENRVPLVTLGAYDHPLCRELPGGLTFGQHTRMLDNYGFPPAYAVGPLFIVDDPAANVLGHYCFQHDPLPAFAVKEFGAWRSIYSGAIQLPAAVIRAAARLAGCHLYLDSDDVVYAGRKFLAVYATAGDGRRTIRLRRPETVWDVFTGKKICSHEREFSVDLRRNQTAGFFLGPRLEL